MATHGSPRARPLTAGMLSQPAILFGLPPAIVHHERCAAYGAPRCEYRVTWLTGEDGETPSSQELQGLRHAARLAAA